MSEIISHEEFLNAQEEHKASSLPQPREDGPGTVTTPERFDEVRRVKEFDREMIKDLGLPPNATKEMIAAAIKRRSEDAYHEQLKVTKKST